MMQGLAYIPSGLSMPRGNQAFTNSIGIPCSVRILVWDEAVKISGQIPSIAAILEAIEAGEFPSTS
jgi:hypothetical protein